MEQFTVNNGYEYEVAAHWISSYFFRDKMRLPSTHEQALAEAVFRAVWIRKRFPNMLLWANESGSSRLAFLSWPQTMDELLEDMDVPSVRSGGNWVAWPFKVISLDEIAMLKEDVPDERRLGHRDEVTPTGGGGIFAGPAIVTMSVVYR